MERLSILLLSLSSLTFAQWEWQQIFVTGDNPSPRYAASSSVYFPPPGSAQRWVICGGQGDTDALTDCYLAVPGADAAGWSFREVTDALDARAKHTQMITKDNNFCILYGGNTSATQPDMPVVLEPGPWQPVPGVTVLGDDIPVARYGHSAVLTADGGRWVVFGGTTFEGEQDLSDVAVLDVSKAASKTFSWTLYPTIASSPAARRYHSAVVYNGAMYVFGGQSGNTVFGDLFSLDLTLYEWTSIAATGVSPLFGHAAVISGSLMLLIGGLTTGGIPTPATISGSVIAVDLNSGRGFTPQVSGPGPSAWYLSSAMLLDDPANQGGSMVAYFGGSTLEDGGALSNDLLVLRGFGQPANEPTHTIVYVIAGCVTALFILISVAFIAWWKQLIVCRRKKPEFAMYTPMLAQQPGVPVGTYSYAYGGVSNAQLLSPATKGFSNTGFEMRAADDDDTDDGRLQLR